MALPKDPRQLMINLMYLVLTAMLAMNITKEVLNAFSTINSSIEGSNVSITDKNNQIYQSFDTAESNPSEKDKVKPFNDKAKEIKSESEKIVAYLEAWKDTVIARAGGFEVDEKGNKTIKSLEDIDAATRLFVEEKKGDEVKEKLNGFIGFLLDRVATESDKSLLSKSFPIQTPVLPKTDENPSGDWTYGTFHNIPVIAAVALLSKYQNDVKNSESIMLEHLMSQIHLEDYKFDALTAIAVPKTSYALEGQEIEATILLAAYNKSVNPTITGGNVVVKDGVGTMKFRASGAGLKTVNGVITIDKSGKKESYPYKFEYMVGSAGASLQLDKMNVMYIGVDNPITLAASGYNIEDVKLHMPDAELTSTGKGTFLAKVTKQGVLDYTISASRGGGQGSAQIGSGKIRVKMIPPPTAMIGPKPVSVMPVGQAKAQQGVMAKLDNFDFEANFKVTSFRFVFIPKTGDAVPIEVKGNAFTGQCKDLIDRSRPGDKWLIENVRAIGPDMIPRSINSVSLTLN